MSTVTPSYTSPDSYQLLDQNRLLEDFFFKRK